MEAKIITKTWLEDYNQNRPHESLANMAPMTFACRHGVPHGITHEGFRE